MPIGLDPWKIKFQSPYESGRTPEFSPFTSFLQIEDSKIIRICSYRLILTNKCRQSHNIIDIMIYKSISILKQLNIYM